MYSARILHKEVPEPGTPIDDMIKKLYHLTLFMIKILATERLNRQKRYANKSVTVSNVNATAI